MSTLSAGGGSSRPTSVAACDTPQDSPRAVLARHRTEVRELVLPAHVAPKIDAPFLRTAAAIAQRSKRNRQFDRPALAVTARPPHPDRVPVPVDVALVGDLPVPGAANRVEQELVAVSPIVKGVEQDVEVVVLADVAPVAAHVVGDDARGLAVAAAGGDVERGRVERDPHQRRLGGDPPLVRLLLHEIGDRGERSIDRFVEDAVDPRRRLDAGGPNGDAVLRSRRHRGRRADGNQRREQHRTARSLTAMRRVTKRGVLAR